VTLCGRQLPHCENLFDYVFGRCEQRRGDEATARRATEKQILEDAERLAQRHVRQIADLEHRPHLRPVHRV
jgi:hypothetical protein